MSLTTNMLKEWKSLEFNLVKVETDKGIIGWGEAFGYTSWKAVKIAIEDMVAPLLVVLDIHWSISKPLTKYFFRYV